MSRKLNFDLEEVKELTEDEKFFCEYLKIYHLGKETFVKAKFLRSFGKPADIRKIVNSVRRKGIPICSDRNGYYFAENLDELLSTIKSMGSRIKSIEEARSGIFKLYTDIELSNSDD